MSNYLVKHYDGTGLSSPTSTPTFNTLELSATTKRLIKVNYVSNFSETISIHFTTPSTTLVICTGDLFITTPGVYYFSVSYSGVVDLLIEDEVVASSYGTTSGSIYLDYGVRTAKLRFFGASSTGNFGVTYKSPSDSSYVEIPYPIKPTYGLSKFPFELYDSVQDTIVADYIILGELYQKQEVFTISEPSKTFNIVTKQNNIEERLDLLSWFDSVKGKYKPFLFTSTKQDMAIIEGINGNYYIDILASYSTIAYSYINKIVYIPSINYIGQTISAESVGTQYGNSDRVFLSNPLTGSVTGLCSEVYFIYPVRLNNDTLTLELEDMRYSSAKLSLYELYNDNGLIYFN